MKEGARDRVRERWSGGVSEGESEEARECHYKLAIAMYSTKQFVFHS